MVMGTVMANNHSVERKKSGQKLDFWFNYCFNDRVTGNSMDYPWSWGKGKPVENKKQLRAILIACHAANIKLSGFLKDELKIEGVDEAPQFRGSLDSINESVMNTFRCNQHMIAITKFRNLLGEKNYTKLIRGQLSLRRQASVPATMSQVPVLSLA